MSGPQRPATRESGAVHGPDCLACTCPAEARRQIAAQRAELDAEAARAAKRRATGEVARRELARLDVASPAYADTQTRMQRELAAANGMFSAVRMRRAHLDRVEDAHPALLDGARQ